MLCYVAAVVGEQRHDLGFDDNEPLVVLDASKSLAHIKTHLEKWTRKLKLDNIILCWSDPDRNANWRLGVLDTYKNNRTGAKPELYSMLRYELEQRSMESVTVPTLEGDDVLGIMQTGPYAQDPNVTTIIMSGDKDMRTIPGQLFSWLKEDEEVTITVEQAAEYHMMQALTGDTVDGYKGLKGCGPKTVVKLFAELSGYDELWSVVLKAFLLKGYTYDDALVQARVSRILQYQDWDSAGQKVIPWMPPKDAK
jgi:DNA polymerase-1